MTIHKLVEQGLVKPKLDRHPSPVSTTIAFAFDGGYLEPFKVMVSSMARANTLTECLVAIYSDDPEVFRDPIVQLVADKTVLLKGSRKRCLYRLAKKNVRRGSTRSHWNRGTFLKWMVFEPQATDQLLFLDVDMICLGQLEDLFAPPETVHFAVAPQFQPALRRLDRPDLGRALADLVDERFSGPHAWRVNSGMMLVRGPLLSQAFFKKITQYAEERVLIHEQAHLSEYFRDHPSHFRMISSRYNFQDRWLPRVSKEDGSTLFRQIKVMHYAGTGKPWEVRKGLRTSRAHKAWLDHRQYASKVLALRTEEGPPPNFWQRLKRFLPGQT